VDAWSEFQAGSIKKQTQQNLAILLAHVGGTPDEIKAANDEAARRPGQQDDLMKEATARDAETAALNEEAQGQLGHHHRFAVSVTLFQVAIGLAAIAALRRRRAVWYGSPGAGALALLAYVDGFAWSSERGAVRPAGHGRPPSSEPRRVRGRPMGRIT